MTPPNAAHAETPRPTPRTDAVAFMVIESDYTYGNIKHFVVEADFARQLERELASAETEPQAERLRGAALAEALKAIADELRKGNKAITDTVWMSDELNTTMLELIEHTLEAHAEGKHQAI